MQTPYSPPRARVADPAVEARPLAATFALVLFGFFVLARCYQLRLPLEQFRTGEISGLWFLLQAVVVACIAIVGLLLSKRVSWARWPLVAIAAWQLYSLRWGFEALAQDMYGVPYGPMDIAKWLFPAVLSTGCTALVFGAARRWFGKRAR